MVGKNIREKQILFAPTNIWENRRCPKLLGMLISNRETCPQ